LVRVPVRKARAGRDTLVAQRRPLELEGLGCSAKLEIRSAVEPGPDVVEVVLDVPERDRHGPILGVKGPFTFAPLPFPNGGFGSTREAGREAEGAAAGRVARLSPSPPRRVPTRPAAPSPLADALPADADPRDERRRPRGGNREPLVGDLGHHHTGRGRS